MKQKYKNATLSGYCKCYSHRCSTHIALHKTGSLVKMMMVEHSLVSNTSPNFYDMYIVKCTWYFICKWVKLSL